MGLVLLQAAGPVQSMPTAGSRSSGSASEMDGEHQICFSSLDAVSIPHIERLKWLEANEEVALDQAPNVCYPSWTRVADVHDRLTLCVHNCNDAISDLACPVTLDKS